MFLNLARLKICALLLPKFPNQHADCGILEPETPTCQG